MAAEIEAAEKKLFGKPDQGDPEKATKEEGAELKVEVKPTPEPEKKEGVIAKPEPEVTSETKGDVTPQQTPEHEDYKKRFSNYKAHADVTIAGLRQSNVALNEQLNELQKTVTGLQNKLAETTKEDPYEGLFTEEEKDLVGEETLAALKKAQDAALNSRLKPLQDQIEAERKRRIEIEKQQLEREKTELNVSFRQKLERLVPDYKKVDLDPKFGKWMAEPDEVSGYPRINMFKAAQSAGDVGRVAEFFKEYIKLTTPEDKLAKKVTPAPANATPATPQKPKTSGLTLKEINKFYDDVTRGKYRSRPKEQQEMERKIDNHLQKIGMGRK
jgi:hypothetical protein